MEIDPTKEQSKEAHKMFIICGVDPVTKLPYPLVVNPVTGELRVNAEFTGDVTVDLDLPDVLSGKKISITGTPTKDQVPAMALKAGASLYADEGNVAAVWLGGSDVAIGDGYPLGAGESVPISMQNLNLLFAVGTAGDVLYYIAG